MNIPASSKEVSSLPSNFLRELEQVFTRESLEEGRGLETIRSAFQFLDEINNGKCLCHRDVCGVAKGKLWTKEDARCFLTTYERELKPKLETLNAPTGRDKLQVLASAYNVYTHESTIIPSAIIIDLSRSGEQGVIDLLNSSSFWSFIELLFMMGEFCVLKTLWSMLKCCCGIREEASPPASPREKLD